MERELLKRFTIGSSVISGLVSFIYIGAGMKRWRTTNWTSNQFNIFEWMMAMVLILMGLFNMVIYYVSKEWQELDEQTLMFLGGAVFGLTLSLIGRSYGFPIKVFGFTKSNINLVHLTAMVLYSAIFGIIIHNLNKFN